MVYSYPSIRSADVPVICTTLGDTVMVVLLMSIPLSFAKEMTVWKVIILVKLATSRETTERCATMMRCVGSSTMIKLSDFTSRNSSGSFTKTGYFFSSFSSGKRTLELVRYGRLSMTFLAMSLTIRCLVFI